VKAAEINGRRREAEARKSRRRRAEMKAALLCEEARNPESLGGIQPGMAGSCLAYQPENVSSHLQKLRDENQRKAKQAWQKTNFAQRQRSVAWRCALARRCWQKAAHAGKLCSARRVKRRSVLVCVKRGRDVG